MNNQYNNNFYGYNGLINRKNYAINIFILIALYFSLSLVKWESFFQFTTYKFLFTILIYIIFCLKFIFIMCSMSLIYRRISDIFANKSLKHFEIAKKFFIFLFVIPILYWFCFKDLLGFYLLNLFCFFIIFPIDIIISIILCFIKGK